MRRAFEDRAILGEVATLAWCMHYLQILIKFMDNWLIKTKHPYLLIPNFIPPVGSLAEWQKPQQDLKQAYPLLKVEKHLAHAQRNTDTTDTACALENSGSAQSPHATGETVKLIKHVVECREVRQPFTKKNYLALALSWVYRYICCLGRRSTAAWSTEIILFLRAQQ